jgi:drug/metabolite transporter (DMT)-like permease
MNSRHALDGRAVRLMLVFCAILGLQQIAIKAAAPDMSPLLQIGLRSGAAALPIGLYLRVRGLGLIPGNGTWLAGIVAGVLFSVEYLFVAEGLRFTSASHMVTMLYTAPAFAALGLHVLIPAERLRPLQWAGLVLAFCGIAVALYEPDASTVPLSGSVLLGDFLGLLAGLSWGATTVVIRTRLSRTPPAQTLFIQLLTCCCLLVPGAMLSGQFSFAMTGMVWAGLLFQILGVCVFGMLLWFWLLTVYPASQLGVLSFLTPVFGIAFGVLLLDEPVEPKFILGAALVLAGIALVSGGQWLTRHIFRVSGQTRKEVSS